MQTNKLINYIDSIEVFSIPHQCYMRYDLKEKTLVFCLKYICRSLVSTFLIFDPPSQLLKNQKTFRQSTHHCTICYYYTRRKLGCGGMLCSPRLFVCLFHVRGHGFVIACSKKMGA